MLGFLYGQTEYNILKNTIFLEKYVEYAKNNNYSFLSLTDSNLHGFYKFYNLCLKNNIKPIIGLEVEIKSSDFGLNYILLYAKNNKGISNLFKISTLIKTNKEIIDINDLKDYSEGIILVTAGEDNELLRVGDVYSNDFISIFNKYSNIFKEVYIGVTSYTSDQIYNSLIYQKYKVLPLHKTLYLDKEDITLYQAFIQISGTNAKEFIDRSNFFPSSDFLSESFFKKESIFDFLDEFIDLFEEITIKTNPKLPKFYDTKGLSSFEYLQNLSLKGLSKRLQNKKVNYNEYLNRLYYELSIINQMGYNDYFLIVWDFVKYAKKNNILVGPGRGSACGSLVSYSLGITNVDPIEYGLLFERFLNIERITMPDIDLDFPDDKRDEVIKYVVDTYGKNRVCNITTFGTFLVKSSIRDLGKVFQISSSRLDTVIKMTSQYSFEDLINRISDEEILKLLITAKKIEGLPKHVSTHAAGIILSDDELVETIPLQNGINQMYQSQLEASDLEKLGLLKIDFLGLKNLSIIHETIKEINMDFIGLSNISLNDKNTYSLLQNADTLGVFQLESQGVKKVLTKLKPTCFEDLVAVISLYRPGPMEYIDEFIERKNTRKYQLIHPDLKEILDSTYGIIVYQEQIMKIALKFGSYSLHEADILRRAISKKDEDVLLKEKNNFIQRAVLNNYSSEVASKVYSDIVKFANYGFNRSHAVAYAMICYQMAYLKANFFQVFISKLMNNVVLSVDALKTYLKYAKSRGVIFVRPSINISGVTFITTNKGLCFPLTGIKQVGISLASEILKERENGLFTSYDDFRRRLPNFNQRALEYLIYAGCFNEFSSTKRDMIENKQISQEVYFKFIPGFTSQEEYSVSYLREKELEAIGFNLEYDVLKNIDIHINNYETTYLKDLPKNVLKKVVLAFSSITEITTKNHQEMAIIKVYDNTKEEEGVIFPQDYAGFKDELEVEVLYLCLLSKYYNSFKNKFEIKISKIKRL